MTPPLGFGEEVMDGERRSRPKHRVFDFDHSIRSRFQHAGAFTAADR
jgi:hypothetical protein